MPDDDLPPGFVAAFTRLVSGPPVELVIRPGGAWVLLASMQLALRHPQYPPSLRAEAERLAQRLVELIAQLEPELRPYAEAGFDPSQDVPVEGSER